MTVWPDIPAPLQDSYQESRGDNTIRSQVERGTAKVRRRTLATPDMVSFSVLLTTAQAATFEDFYDIDVKSGSLSFDMTHPRTGETRQFRFKAPPSYVPVGKLWRVSVSLELLKV